MNACWYLVIMVITIWHEHTYNKTSARMASANNHLSFIFFLFKCKSVKPVLQAFCRLPSLTGINSFSCENVCLLHDITLFSVCVRDALIPILVSVSGPIPSSSTRTRTRKNTPIPKTDTPWRHRQNFHCTETTAAATECQAQRCGNISTLMMTTHAWQTANFAPQKYQEEVQKAVLIIRVIW